MINPVPMVASHSKEQVKVWEMQLLRNMVDMKPRSMDVLQQSFVVGRRVFSNAVHTLAERGWVRYSEQRGGWFMTASGWLMMQAYD